MVIIGIIHSIQNPKTFESGFTVQEFYLDTSRHNQYTDEKYENYAKFQVLNKKINLELFKPDDIVRVSFNINGKVIDQKDSSGKVVDQKDDSKKKFFVQNLTAYKIEPYQRSKDIQPTVLASEQAKEMHSLEKDDDLPF